MNIKEYIKRPSVWGTLIALAVMAAVAVAFFYPDNFDGNVLSQDDVRQGIANGEEARAYHDATGETTRWTNSLFSGMPTFQISPSYPSDGLFKWINSLYSFGLPGCSGLLMMMMLGMYIMLMAMGTRWYLSLIGAIAWGFSSYYIIIIGAGHLWKFYTLTYVPPTIGGVIVAYRGRLLTGAALTAFGMMMQISWNHIQMTYYFGFLILILAICYFVEARRTKALKAWWKSSCVLALAALIGVASNAPNLYFTSRYTPESIRGGHSELTLGKDPNASTGGLDKDYITQYSYGRGETLTLMIPNIKGGASAYPKDGKLQYASIVDLDGAHDKMSGLNSRELQYLPYSTQYFGEPESTNGPVYVGVIICALFLFGCCIVKGPLKWGLLAATLLSIGLAWGRNLMPLTDLFISLVPGYSKFRTPESILVVAELTMPVLAILALCKAFTTDDRKSLLKPLAISFGIVGLLCLVGWLAPGIYGSTTHASDVTEQLIVAGYTKAEISAAMPNITSVITDLRHSLVAADSLRSLIFVLLGGGALYWWIKGGKKGYVAGALGVLILVDLYGVDKRYVNHESFNKPVRQTIVADAADRAILADTTANYRVLPMGQAVAQPDRSYFHKSVGGYHAAKLARYNDVFNNYLVAAAQGAPEADGVVNMLNAKYRIYGPDSVALNPGALGNAWLVDNISYVDSPDNEFLALQIIDPATEAVADGRFANVLGEAIPKVPGDTIYETSYSPNRLTYSATTARGGVAVFSEVYFPWGWQATVDGEPVEIGRVNYILRAIKLPAGHHTVEMVFKVDAVKTTCAVASVATFFIYILMLAAIVYPFYRRR